MASTVTPHEDMNPSPRVDVFIDDADLDPATVTITVHQLSGAAGDVEVQNMRGVSAVGGFAATDYTVPFGVPVTYRVEQFDGSGVELGYALELTTQVDTESNVAVVSDPLAPGSAVKVRAEVGFAAQLTRRRPTKVYRAGFRTVALGGLQGLLEDVPLRCWTDSTDDRDMFAAVTAEPLVLVRTMPNFPIPRVLYATIPDVVQDPFDYHNGGTTDVWDVTGSEVSRPELDIIVAVINYQLFADHVAAVGDGTYGFAATLWSSYIDALRYPPSAA